MVHVLQVQAVQVDNSQTRIMLTAMHMPLLGWGTRCSTAGRPTMARSAGNGEQGLKCSKSGRWVHSWRCFVKPIPQQPTLQQACKAASGASMHERPIVCFQVPTI